jgi:hypothetical protein
MAIRWSGFAHPHLDVTYSISIGTYRHKVTTRGKNNINIWLPVIISILIGQLRNIFRSKRPRSSSVFGCSVN